MLDEGRKIFRYDTFGSESFWGDALQLHKAIRREKRRRRSRSLTENRAVSRSQSGRQCAAECFEAAAGGGQGRP
jgi:hypothetical protein